MKDNMKSGHSVNNITSAELLYPPLCIKLIAPVMARQQKISVKAAMQADMV